MCNCCVKEKQNQNLKINIKQDTICDKKNDRDHEEINYNNDYEYFYKTKPIITVIPKK